MNRQQREYQERTELQRNGWDIDKRDVVAFNSGSETATHTVAKTLCAQILKEHGYRVDSEVEGPNGQVADLVAYGADGRNPIAVELETEYSRELALANAEKYAVSGISECYTLGPPSGETTIVEAKQRLEEALFA